MSHTPPSSLEQKIEARLHCLRASTGRQKTQATYFPRRANAGAWLVVLPGLLAYGFAAASGFTPLAFDDSATVPRSGTVNILDTGQASVLANDFDIEGDQLTAFITRSPRRGTVVLNDDGSFLYTHNGSRRNSDEFRYEVFDGTSFSREARVRISVVSGAVAPVITGQRSLSTSEDGSLVISLQDIFVQDSDSAYPTGFSLNLGSGANYTVQGASISPNRDFNGSLTVPTWVNDGQADSNTFPLSITVRPVNDGPVVVGSIPNQQANEGTAFSLDVAARFADVDTGDRLTFAAQGLPPSGSLTLNAQTGELAGVPVAIDAQVQSYNVTVTATDTSGASISTGFALAVAPRPSDLGISITVEPEPATFGTAPQWSFDVANNAARASAAASIVASWGSTGAPVSLSVPAECVVTDNSTFSPELQCDIGIVPASATVTVRIQSQQAAAGDQAVLARVEDTSPSTGSSSAFKSLSLAGGFNTGAAQRLPDASTDLALADLNGDGFTDLVAVSDVVRVYFNSGEKSFIAEPQIASVAGLGQTLALLDWNNDSFLDIAVLAISGTAGQILLNDGFGQFVAGPQLPALSALAAISTDLDLDGTQELTIVGSDGTYVIQPQTNPQQIDGRPGHDINVFDTNGSGRQDIAVALTGNGAVAVLQNVGGGSFPETTYSGFGNVAGISSGDINGDGADDLLLGIDATGLEIPQNVILVNDGGGTFAATEFFGATETRRLLAADANRDGFTDIVSINATGVHQVYAGGSQQLLQLQPEFVLGPNAATAELADIDNDGALDLLLAGPKSTSIVLLRNDGIGRFGFGDITPPVIELVGLTSVTVPAASTYVDAGATAIDDVSGDLTAEIAVNNPVDVRVVGTYTISYDVSDPAGNASPTVFRTVTVEPAVQGGGGGGASGWLLLLTLSLFAYMKWWAARMDAESRHVQ